MNIIFKIGAVVSLMAIGSCSDHRKEADSNDIAKEANDRTFDDHQAEQDADFVEEVVASNYAEIKLSELANQRSRNAEVKEIARVLEKDHTNALNELKSLAQAKGISVPVEETDDAKRKMENFTGETGSDFDKKWCKEMIDTHEDNIDKFESRMEKTKDAALKNWISKTLPTLRTYHDRLKACHEKIKDSNS